MKVLDMKHLSRLLAFLSFAFFSSFALAAPIDVGAVVTDIGAQIAPVVLIGSAVLLVFVAVKAFRWVRGALS